jgi:hypothetical protein
MKVAYICGYYSDLAEAITGKPRPRDPPFWEAFMFCWAVKSGRFHKNFYIERKSGRLHITRDNFHLVRPTFGAWAARILPAWFSKDPVLLVPVPNKSAVQDAVSYPSLEMAQQAFKGTTYADSIRDALRWSEELVRAHEGGPRKRAELLPFLAVRPVQPELAAKQIVLIDDLWTTGGSLLACHDKLSAEGANVVGAITCGHTVYDDKEPPFKARSVELTEELSDMRG